MIHRLKEHMAQGSWTAALIWGIGVALLHRLVLIVWLGGVWLALEPALQQPVNFHDPGGDLPALATRAHELLFGVVRRWDAVHYLNLAAYGYRPSYPGPTVFGPLTPLGFRLFDAVLPGGLDLAAMVFETVCFAAALVFLYRLCAVYYRDPGLAPWAVALTAIIPVSYVFAAPLSEAPYFALAIAMVYFGARERWGRAALCGILATLARSQGILLLGAAVLLLLEVHLPRFDVWRKRLTYGAARAWPVMTIPLGFVGFNLFRAQAGLPPLFDVYTHQSFSFFVNPLEGLWINVRYILEDPLRLLTVPDMGALALSILLGALLFVFPRHRRLTTIGYTFGFILLYVSRVNWYFTTHEVMYTQSIARYSAVLFPLTVLVADGLRRAPGWGRLLGVAGLTTAALAFAALNTLAILGP